MLLLNTIHIEDVNSRDINLESTWIDELHKQFTDFYQQIEDAKNKIISLQDNWDEEGGKSYKKETLERATEFIKKLSFFLWKQTEKLIFIPRILPGPDGSIDIHWKNDKFDLLVNFPEVLTEPA